jgi:class 3 adenylate cyclase
MTDGEAQQQYAILFADIASSTRLYETLGDAQAMSTIESVLDQARIAVLAHQGRIVKTIGDEVMAVLPSADEGMLAASDIQLRVSALPPAGANKLAIRIGFHYGPAIEERNDYFGDAVNVAARMTALAKGGQIITNAESVEALSPLLRQSTRSLYPMAVAGKAEEIRICEVIWQDGEEHTMITSRDVPVSEWEPKLRVKHAGREIIMSSKHPTVTIGRDAVNEIVIGDRKASRMHGRIEHRRGKYYVVDQSTNGTFVTIEKDPELTLIREQAMLRGRGLMSFGHSSTDPGAELVLFELE